MKKTFLMLSAAALIFLAVSCAASKEARSYRNTIDGNWQLETITTEGITGKIKARILNESDFNCFVGSTWNFNKRNSLGYYSIAKNGGECVAIKRNIRWSVYEEEGKPKMLQYKRVDEKYKEMDADAAGFRFTILSADNNSMKLRNDITFEGKPASFIYNFVKN